MHNVTFISLLRQKMKIHGLIKR